MDQVEGDESFGFDRFPGDRPGSRRSGHAPPGAGFTPTKVTHAAVLDIIPTRYLYPHVTMEFVRAYFHWFNYLAGSTRARRTS
jgi:haloacetate dehalogenase